MVTLAMITPKHERAFSLLRAIHSKSLNNIGYVERSSTLIYIVILLPVVMKVIWRLDLALILQLSILLRGKQIHSSWSLVKQKCHHRRPPPPGHTH